jgi:hypothetical protein
MIYPKQNFFIFSIFRRYVKWIVGWHFCELKFDAIEADKNRSVLLIANHFSFWDALILFCVNDVLFRKKFHVMILESTSKRERFLKYGGAFSVNKSSRDLVQSLDYAAELLKDPGNLVLMFPQGKLYSNFVEHIHFEKGVQRIIDRSPASDFQLMFAATFVQYFKHKKPTATVYLKGISGNFADISPGELQSAYQQHYDASKRLQTEIDI